jgi:hypothetical protein
MTLSLSAVSYYCLVLIINLGILICASPFRVIPVAVLWLWLFLTFLAYLVYEVVMPAHVNIRLDLAYLWPLLLGAALACGLRTLFRR